MILSHFQTHDILIFLQGEAARPKKRPNFCCLEVHYRWSWQKVGECHCRRLWCLGLEYWNSLMFGPVPFFWFKNPMFIHVSGIVCFFQTDFFSEWYELQHVTVCLMDPNGMLDHREMTRIFLVKQSPSYGFWVMFLTPQLRPAPFFRCFWGLVFSAVQSRPGL